MILKRGLSNNQLSGAIPSSIGSLVNLSYLYAQSNIWHPQLLILPILSITITTTPLHHQTHLVSHDAHTFDDTWWYDRTGSSSAINWAAPFHHRLALSWIFRTCTSIQHLTFTTTHSSKLLHHQQQVDNIYHTVLTHSILVVDYDVDIEQRPHQQSTKWRHSIIDWLSRESSLLVRQSNIWHSQLLILPSFSITNNK